MPNVGFKHGTQANMDKIVNTTVAGSYGTFYLTSDTSRLYVGNADNKVVPVNEHIIRIANRENLPDIPSDDAGKQRLYRDGIYYYLENENILCIFNGQYWVQINSIVTNHTLTTDIAAVTGGVSVETTVEDSSGGEVKDSYTVKGDKGISVTADGDVMTIAPTKVIKTDVTSATKGATVTLADSGLVDASNKDFSIVSGDDVVTVAAEGKTIKITAVDTKNTDMAVENRATSGFEFSVSQTPGDRVTAQFDPAITIGKGDTSDVKFSNGKAVLNVYTTAQTDKLIADKLILFNSMTYCGTRNADEGLPTSDVHVGDTYLLNSDNFPYDGETYDKGTLAIARGEEDPATGIITGAIEWDFVTGSEVDTQYTLKTNNIAVATVNENKSVSLTHSINLVSSTGFEQEKKTSFQIDSLNDNLQIKAMGSSVQMNLVWDTF